MPFLFELLPFPYSLVWRRLPTCDRFEKENGRGFLLPCLSLPIRSVRYRTATHTGYSTQARHKVKLPEGQERVPWGITVPRNSLARIFCTATANCTRCAAGCAESAHPAATFMFIVVLESCKWQTLTAAARTEPPQRQRHSPFSISGK